MAFKIDAFLDLHDFKTDLDKMLRHLAEMKPAPGHDRVYYAGLIEHEESIQRRENGIPYHTEVVDCLTAQAIPITSGCTGPSQVRWDLNCDTPHVNPKTLAVELARLRTAREQIPQIANRYKELATFLQRSLPTSVDKVQAAHNAASALWTERARTRDSINPMIERYIGALGVLRNRMQSWARATVPVLERTSRNLHFESSTDERYAVITGFDPFGLNSNIQQCNPSGIFALMLNDKKIGDFRVKSMFFPVRYADFDNKIVENTLKPVLQSKSTGLVLTVSMGREGFDLERFPAKCRGARRLDNQDIEASIDADSGAFYPPLEGPSFVEYSLPTAAALSHLPPTILERVTDNRRVRTVESGAFDAKSLKPLLQQTAVAGSGGDFLSNEISYRTLNLQAKLGTSVPTGHIHVPRCVGYDENQIAQDSRVFRELLNAMVACVS